MKDSDNPFSRVESTLGPARHIGWDFAAKGDWLHSEDFYFNVPKPKKPDHVFSWLAAQTTGDIACEALFELGNGQRFFLGVGTLPLTTHERKDVIGKFLAMPQDGRSLVETVDSLQKAWGSDLPIDRIPNSLTLGVGGLWNGVGELLVWRKGGHPKIMPFTDIPTKHAALCQPQPRNIMMEAQMGSAETFPCWLGFPVSQGVPERHTLSRNAYYGVAALLSPGAV